MTVDDLTAKRVRQLFRYDSETGEFTRLVKLAIRHRAGDRADFSINTGPMAGYRRIAFDSKRYLAHRVAWLYVFGTWPSNEIDHINGDRGDNRIANLRDVDGTVNRENLRIARCDNKCGLLGVHWHPEGGKWRARIQSHGRTFEVGLYSSKEEAHQAYVAAKRSLHAGCTI